MRYPPNWFDLGSNGGPAHLQVFATEKGNGSLVQMSPNGMWAMVDADCESGPGGHIRLISQADATVGGVPAIRYIEESVSGVGPPATLAITTVKPGAACYRIEMEALSLQTLEKNLADFDLMLASVRFSARTAPAVTPLETTPPTR